MHNTCNQANDLIIVIQCNGFVPVVRNAFFLHWAFGLWFFFFWQQQYLGLYGPSYTYMYVNACMFTNNILEFFHQMKMKQ